MDLAAYVAHQIPGRVRLRIPAARGREDLLRRIVATADSAGAIKRVDYNSITGSVLVEYAAEAYQSLTALGSALSDSTVRISIHASRPNARKVSRRNHRGNKTEPSAAAKAITSLFRSVDQEIRDASENEVDLKVILPLAAGSLGLIALRRQAMSTPLWLTLMIFAFHSFLTLHDVAEVEAADEIIVSGANETSDQ